MPASVFSKILLLIDQATIAVDERNRLILLGSELSETDNQEILSNLKHILDQIHRYEQNAKSTTESENVQKLINGYNELLDELKHDKSLDMSSYVYIPSPEKSNHNDEQSPEESQNETRPLKMSKSVRFKDKLVDDSPVERYLEPYRDDPDASPDSIHAQNQQLMTMQDERLDGLARTVGRHHELSIQIDDELSGHIGLLDEVDELTDRSQNRLNQAKRRLDKFSRKAAQSGSWLTIFILLLIFLILVLVLK